MNRILKEKEFHNNRFIADNRKKISGVYAFANTSKELFNNLVAKVMPGDNVLEIGCGVNSISKKLVDIGADVTMIDISLQAIDL